MMPLILASASRARAQILRAAGVDFEQIATNIDEAQIKAANSGTPSALALALAIAKANALDAPQNACVIAADQILDCNGKLYDKPATLDEARAQLIALRNKQHALISAVALKNAEAIIWEHVSIARLTMRDFSDAFLDAYLDKIGMKTCNSVGGYQLEGLGSQLFSAIEGDYFTILGLPLIPLLNALRKEGAL